MHVLIAGTTMSGKTTLAKKLVGMLKNNGIKTLVLDPLFNPTWGADFVTHDNDIFLDTMYKSRKCALFLDESGSNIGRYSGAMQVVATQSRHLGHKAHFITQRPTQLDKTIRDQCPNLFLFRVSKSDAETLADEFCNNEIKQARNLAQGEFLMITRFARPILMNIFEEEIPIKHENPENTPFSEDENNSEEIENNS